MGFLYYHETKPNLKGLYFVEINQQSQEDKLEKKSSSGSGWIEAARIFTEISTWIAVPIILAVIGGKALDSHFGTRPTLFLISVVLAFIVSSYGIVRTVKSYTGKIKQEK